MTYINVSRSQALAICKAEGDDSFSCTSGLDVTWPLDHRGFELLSEGETTFILRTRTSYNEKSVVEIYRKLLQASAYVCGDYIRIY